MVLQEQLSKSLRFFTDIQGCGSTPLCNTNCLIYVTPSDKDLNVTSSYTDEMKTLLASFILKFLLYGNIEMDNT